MNVARSSGETCSAFCRARTTWPLIYNRTVRNKYRQVHAVE